MRFSLFLCALFASILLIGACRADSTKLYRCPKVSDPPVIDGVLDDEAWMRAPAVMLVDNHTAQPAKHLTIARMCWDDTCLYVSFQCSSTDVWGTVTEHDGAIFLQECVEIFADPDCDLASYVELDVSPRNVTYDAMFDPANGITLDTNKPSLWTCEGWRTAVRVDGTLNNHNDIDRGWSAEIAVPFASIGTRPPVVGQVWRLNLYRVIGRSRPWELDAWSATQADGAAFHVPSRFGTVVFADEGRMLAKAPTRPKSDKSRSN